MYKELHAQYQKDKKGTTERLKEMFGHSNLMQELYEQFATVPLVRNEKISMFNTLNELKDNNEDLFHAILFIGILSARSAIYNSNNKDKFNIFVPIFMAAQKEYNDVIYEEWDKKDKAIEYAVGVPLWKELQDYLYEIEGLDDNLQQIRDNAVSEAKHANNQTGFYFTWLSFNNRKVPKIISAIKGQFWFCHPENRNKYMILDTINWDNIPESLVYMTDTIIEMDNSVKNLFGDIF